MPNSNTKGISVHVERELHAEITAYLQENNMKMGDFKWRLISTEDFPGSSHEKITLEVYAK